MRTTVHIVPHTHWDREWYLSAAPLQLRLAALVDDLLATLDSRPELPSFLLDGQAVVLDDYLALRPEGAAALRGALAGRRIEAGPWYVLADELLVSGEALVRNLLAGARAVRRGGGAPVTVGNSADALGQ